MTHDKDSFEAGYLLAVANIMHLHGEEMIGTDVLQDSGISSNAVRRLALTEFDAKPLRRLFRNISRRNRL